MKNILFAFTVLCGIALWSQEVKVEGKLRDENNFPVPYVTVTFEGLGNGTTDFTETLSDENGHFTVNLKKGKYDMIIQPPSGMITEREEEFFKDTDFGIIILDNAIQLSETVAVGEKPLYRLELDKRVYDMERDPTVKGANLSDALNNVPSVQVDSEGTITLRGNASIRVLINGKPSAMTGISNVGEALKNIPAETVQRVEVITNPSARYDAEGGAGIINIVLKKGSNKGFNANINTSLGYQPQAGISASINYKTNKWNWFINPSYRYSKTKANSYFNNLLFYDNDIDTLELTDRERERERNGAGVNLGFEHYLSKKTTVSVSGNYRNTPSTVTSKTLYTDFANDVLFGSSRRVDVEKSDEYSVEGNVGVKHEFNAEGHEINVQSSISHSKEKENNNIQDIVTLGEIDDVFQKGYTNETEDRMLVQLDYVFPINKNKKFEAGYKSEWENEITDFGLSDLIAGNYVENPLFVDVVDFQQNIHAFYMQYGQKFGRFSFLAGMRLENSDISIKSENSGNITKDKNYTNLFPSATLNYSFDEEEENQLQLSYSRRIRRPWSRFLNPSYNFSDLRNTFRGNPDLDPTYSNNFELAYLTSIGKTSITPSIYYSKNTNDLNVFRRLETIDNVGQVFLAQPVNAGNVERYGAELVVSTQPTKWWRLFGNFNVFGYKSNGSYVDDNGTVYPFDGDGLSWFTRISNNFNLPAKINFQLNGNLRGAEENAQERRKLQYSVDLAFSKDLFKDKATLSFNVRDVFNSRRRQETNYGQNFISEIDMQWRPRTFTLNFSYRINQKKRRQRGNRDGGMNDGDGMEM